MEDPIEEARKRLVGIFENKYNSSDQQSLDFALEAFSDIFEKLQVAKEELRLQNEELFQTRELIEEEQKRYRELFELAPDAYLVTDEKGLILEANQAASELFNAEKDRLIGKPILVFIGKEDIRLVSRAIVHPELIRDLEVRIRPLNGKKTYVSITANKVPAQQPGSHNGDRALHDQQRALHDQQRAQHDQQRALHDQQRALQDQRAQVRWILRDVSERRKAVDALDASERRFRTIFDQANQGIALLDLEGKILKANSSLLKMLDSCEKDLLGQPFAGLAFHEDQSTARETLAAVSQGNLILGALKTRFPLASGEIVWTSIALSPLVSEQNKIQLVIAMVENITAEKQAQNELAEMRRRLLESGESERLRLAQELHDGPMQDLYGAVFHLSNTPNAQGNPELEESIKQAQDMMKLVAGTLRSICGELRPPTIANLGLERAIRSHAGQIQDLHPEIEMQLQLTSDGQALPAHTRLAFFRIYQQCMTNILRHAHASKVMISFHINEEEITLDVWDNGKGFTLPEKWVELLRQGHYGLAGIAERVEALRGTLKIDTKPGAGTLVHVSAPVGEEEEV